MTKTFSFIFGIILVLLGLFGFTSNSLIGANALFSTDIVHNLIHLILGGVLLAVAVWAGENAVFWLKVIGAMIFLLGLIGLLTTPSIGGPLLAVAYSNGMLNWFHLIFGVGIFAAGVYGKDEINTGRLPIA